LKYLNFENRGSLLCILILCAMLISGCRNIDENKGIFVIKWNNIYDGNNIRFYYEDFNNENIKEINKRYNISDIAGDLELDLEAALKLQNWVHNKFDFQKSSISTKEDALSILEEHKSIKKASDREYAIVFSQAASSIGIYARRGELRTKESANSIENEYLMVCEVWSDKYNKWILLDLVNNVYMRDDGIPLSAVEVISKGLASVEIVGDKDVKRYIKEVNKYFYSYSIEIDNNIYGTKKSNSYVTYLKSGEMPKIKTRNEYLPPTIFVSKEEMLIKSPKTEYKNDNSDSLPTIILMKKTLKDQKDEAIVCGVFKNSSMVPTYYLSQNGSQWVKIDKYFDSQLKEGSNSIRISEDGEMVSREIIIDYRK
jgi:hypothetical protein